MSGNVRYDTASADAFLSSAVALFLEDNIPAGYLEDPDTAEACVHLCVLGWNLGVMETDVRLKGHASEFMDRMMESPVYAELAADMEENFDAVVRILADNKISDFSEYRDLIKSWELGEAGDEDIPDDQFPVFVKGCSAEEINDGAFA